MNDVSEMTYMDDYGIVYKPEKPVLVIKKDGSTQEFNVQKVISAVNKSAYRALTDFTDDEKRRICQHVVDKVNEIGELKIPISLMHNIVEEALEKIKPIVAKSYRDYRNYKQDFVRMMDDVYKKSQSIMYIGDKENANTDSALVSTKRSLVFNQFNKELYQKFFMTTEEIQACRDGYIYVHDMSARRDTMNCFTRFTRFVTDKGVKSFADFKDGDTVTVPSHKGIMRNAVVHSYGRQPLQIVTFAAIDSKCVSVNVVVTPDHRWILRNGSETIHLSVGDELILTPEIKDDLAGMNWWKNWRVTNIKPFHEEEVWCLEVEEDHSFLLEYGIPTGNCCLADVKTILKNGFEMGNVWYNEPKTLDVVFDVIGDIVLSMASQQYGGYTVPEVDKLLEPYAEKSYKKYLNKYLSLGVLQEKAKEAAYNDVAKDMEQGFQGWEYKFNTVASSRGDYPFITVTAGLGTGKFAKLASMTMFKVRKNGQGKKGHKKPVLFPKLVFLYDENLHGPGKELEDVFDIGVECSRKTMYPDWLSLTGNGYVPSMYKKYGEVVSNMGCRAFLSPWYERGGMHPADEDDKPVFVGRFNIGAVSLHLPMILAKSRQEGRDFHEVLDYYLNLIRQLHIRTYAYLGEMRASTNPLGYCEGGFYGGRLNPHDKIKPLLKPMTASFGITALNELQILYNGKSLVQDGEFALETLRYINDKVNEFKEKDGNLYAIYGTPAENLCFDADTMVQCYGENKRIADINVGDLVYSFNEETHKVELKPVVRSMKTYEDAKVVKVIFEDDQYVICTPNHPFGVITGERLEYVEAEKLVKDMSLKSNGMSNHKVKSMGYLAETRDVYDITVEDNHNFFVGDNGVLVHNCGLQIKQFRAKYGIIEGVSDREYVSNSFHCHVAEDITPIQKQDLEYRFWDLCNGGKIQYVKYPIDYNVEAIKTLIRRAMDMGLYEGVNLSLAYCENCGHQELEMDVCPKCGSRDLTKIDRMNGYLSYSRVHGDTRLNDAKMAEIAERKSM